MRFFFGVDGGQSGTTALIGDETGACWAAAWRTMQSRGRREGRAKLERAVLPVRRSPAPKPDSTRPPCSFTAACFGMSGGPEDKQAILGALLPADRMMVTDDAVTALAGATAHGPGNRYHRRHRLHRLRPQCRRPHGARRRMGLRLRRRRRRVRHRAPGVARRAAHGRRLGASHRLAPALLDATGSRTPTASASFLHRPIGRGRVLRPWLRWWMKPRSRRRGRL